MSLTSIGDLARSFQFRRDTAGTASEVQRLAGELSGGRTADLGRALAGDTAPVAALTRGVQSLSAYDHAASEAVLVGAAAGQVLGRIAGDSDSLISTLLLTRTAGQVTLVDAAARDARARFASAVAGLNTQAAGRAVFAGQAFDSPALAPAETILGDLYATVSAAPDPASALAAIDAWFAPGGGFETAAYQGSAAPATPVRIGDGEAVSPALQATDPRIVATLAATATAALLDLGLFAGQGAFRADVASAAADGLLNATEGLTEARAVVGLAEGRADAARTRIAAERGALELTLSEITAADPYETASRLRDAEDRLQLLYVLTGRLADLTLAKYLR